MADNVAVTPGSGASIATDDVGGVQFQKVKLDAGGDGVSAPVSQDFGLPVGGKPAAFAPGYGAADEGADVVGVDAVGQLLARATVLTDEGTFRANFSGTSIGSAIGTATFVNGSATVTVSLSATTDLHAGDYIKLDADAESAWAQVDSIDSLTQVTLTAAYAGAGGTGASSRALLQPTTGTGATIGVASAQATISCGATGSATTSLRRFVDYGPLVFRARLSVSQRVANQTIYVGCYEDVASPRWFARFAIDDVTNTTVKCQTGRNPTGAPSASETEETTITLPNAATTASARVYRIEVLTEVVRFFVDDVLMATHARVIPCQHDELTAGVRCVNSSTPPAGGTSIVIDYVVAKNHNKIEAGFLSDAESVVVRGYPGQYVQGTDVAANNTNVIVIDCAQIRTIGAFFTAPVAWSGVTVTFQASMDGTNWISIYGHRTDSGGRGVVNTATAALTSYIVPTQGMRWVRFRTTGYTSGTVRGFFFMMEQVQHLTGQVDILNTVTVSGTVTVTSTRITPNAADGHSSTHHLISANTTNATSVKASAGAIGMITVSNINAAVRYFKLYNKASAPTVGTDTPVMTVAVPPNTTLVIGGNSPIRCSTGIAYALTTGMAVADTGAVAATELSVSIFYT